VVATLNAAMESEVYMGRFTHVKEITTTPDGGVMVKLAVPYENLPILLDVPILKATELERDRPVGTGPYRLDATTEGMRLTRRIDWWCKANLPITADIITLMSTTDAVHIRDEFEFGDVNLVCNDPTANDRADYRCDYELWDSESGLFLYLGCNTQSIVFSKATVRAALTHAIDREKLTTTHYRGFARTTTLPVSPQSPYYSMGLAARYEYNPTKFAQAVIAAELAGQTVVLLVNRDDTLRLQLARDIGDMLTECGLTVTMSELKTEDYRRALRKGQFDLYLGQTRLSANMDLSEFFGPEGSLDYGALNDVGLYTLCQEALANQGNYYNLHQQVAGDGRVTSLAFLSYAVFADRGLLTNMAPARDNIFYYDLGRTLESAKLQ
jgi:peptide/nickel transport system substrate-binding protein